MRLVLAFAALTVALFVDVPASRAQDGNARWCAEVNSGFENLSVHCIFRTLEECVPFVIAGNRGICNENPYYAAIPAKRGKPRVKAR